MANSVSSAEQHSNDDDTKLEVKLRRLLQALSTTRCLDEDVFQEILSLTLSSKHHSASHSRAACSNESIDINPDNARQDSLGGETPPATTSNGHAVGNTVKSQVRRKRDRAVTFAKKAMPFVSIVSGLLGLGLTTDRLVDDSSTA